MLWLCMWVPAGISTGAKPISVLYFNTGSPWRMNLAATLWPDGTSCRVVRPSLGTAVPAGTSIRATTTLSRASRRMKGLKGRAFIDGLPWFNFFGSGQHADGPGHELVLAQAVDLAPGLLARGMPQDPLEDDPPHGLDGGLAIDDAAAVDIQ